MKLVIDIPEEEFERMKEKKMFGNVTVWKDAIRNGTPLPKGHGRLIDADALETAYGIEGATKYGNESKEQLEHSYGTMMMYEIADMLDYAPTIIGADKEEEGDD